MVHVPGESERAAQAPTPTDELLVASIGAGDMDALRQLVQRYQDRVRRLAWRMLRDEHAADDVAQDVFLRVHGAAPRHKPTARVSTWIYQITLNLCRDRLRRSKRRIVSIQDAAIDPPAPSMRDGIDADETARRVRRAVDALPERQRTAVVLHRYEGLAHERIAEVTGWSRSAVESLIVRAYATLRKSLADLR